MMPGAIRKRWICYNSAEQSGNSQRDILYARSLTYDRMGEVAKAEQDLRAILADDPEDADALNALGYADSEY
ncbi:MAG: hypothetical protein R3E89_18075 [Thiolinea sp.]